MTHYAAWILLQEPIESMELIDRAMEQAKTQGLEQHMDEYMFCQFDDMYLDAPKSVLTGAELLKVNTDVFIPRFLVDVNGDLHDAFNHKSEWPVFFKSMLESHQDGQVAMVLVIMKAESHGPVVTDTHQSQLLAG